LLGVVTVLALVKPNSPSLNALWHNTGQAWLHGADLYDLHGASERWGYRYGPLIAAVLAALAKLPLGPATALLRLANAAVLLAATLSWLRYAAPGKLEGGARAAFLILLGILSVPNLESSQLNPLVIGLLLGSATAIHGQRWNLAAGLLALAVVLKVYPLALALLLLVVYPRQLGLRLLLALLAALGLPFLLQHPGYVLRQYELWLQLLAANDAWRRFLPLTIGETYRDLLYLIRLYNIPITLSAYAVVQGLTALACAALCWTAARRPWPRPVLLWQVLVLGTAWMTLCGPASEPRTYILVAPAVAWWTVWTYQHGPRLAGLLAGQACGLLVLCVVSGVSPHSVVFFRSAGLHPLAVLLLLASWWVGVRHAALTRGAPAAVFGFPQGGTNPKLSRWPPAEFAAHQTVGKT
jgi:hypothetical protein